MWPISNGIYNLHSKTYCPSNFVWKKKIPFNNGIINLFLLQVTHNTGLHKFSKNPRVTSKFWAPEMWREAITILRIQKYQATLKKVYWPQRSVPWDFWGPVVRVCAYLHNWCSLYVLLTVHFSNILFLVSNLMHLFVISFHIPLHVSSHIVLIIRRIYCIYTASGSLCVTLLVWPFGAQAVRGL